MADRITKNILRIIEEAHKEIETIFETFFHHRLPAFIEKTFSPSTDLYETPEEIILLLELPGVDPEDINISINDKNVLHIWGQRLFPLPPLQKGRCHKMEIPFGSFSRYIKLPCKIESTCEIENINGIFKIRFRKKKPKIIEVEVEDD